MTKGELIRAIRKKQKLTQIELSKLLGVTQMALSAWEIDAHGMTAKHAFNFIKWAGKQGVKVSLEQLLAG